MEQFIASDPVRLNQAGKMQHDLLDEDKRQGASNKHVMVIYSAAPLLVDREMDLQRTEDWLHFVRHRRRRNWGVLQDDRLYRSLIPNKTLFLSAHDNLRGRRRRSVLRVKFQWVLHTTCLRESRITCYGDETPVQHFAPGPACSSRVCPCRRTNPELLEYIPEILRDVGRRWDLPFENLQLEILMKHSCESKACFGYHIWYTIRHLTSPKQWALHLVIAPIVASWVSLHPMPLIRTMIQTMRNESPTERAWWLRVVFAVIPIGVLTILLKPFIWSLLAFGNWVDRQTWLGRACYAAYSVVVKVKTAIESTLTAVGLCVATAVVLPFICVFAIWRVTHDRVGRQ
ncbi:hypothetical protein CKM354_000641800 [Cercospora kikuchii]|uniref:Uncharacterized protein n=1 Tax=Cercospora kikuchii TaxID=84275 RepID=A0A9P3CP10_9PEZI|nr:uncharacterized protein CKM354_000641800 [Cercospora kikuchii]GIZ43180.1 hypothetical protein CKM354_000641800 [Cercospora kikuchii]